MASSKTKTTKGSPRLKNYRSQADESSIFEAIRQSLASRKAKRIMFDYDDDGRAIGIEFTLVVAEKVMTFKLPARLGNVEVLVKQSYVDAGRGISEEALAEQSYRTAWANIRDWIDAQIALIATGMVRMEEVFMPYLLVEPDKTMFEAFAEQRALPASSQVQIKEVS